MFERFTTEARQAVAGAQLEARRLNHGWIGTEHLLLALLTQDTASSAVLFRYELTHDAVLDAIRGCRGATSSTPMPSRRSASIWTRSGSGSRPRSAPGRWTAGDAGSSRRAVTSRSAGGPRRSWSCRFVRRSR